jgi:hypothetical protein
VDSRTSAPTTEHRFGFTVDGAAYQTTAHELTPRQILDDYAHADSSTHYLVQIEGRHQVPYKDDPNVEIHMHEGMTFVTVSTGPTPVS